MEILGLVDTLEAMILEGFKIPLTKKTVIDEEDVLQVLDKIRLVAQGGDVKAAISQSQRPVITNHAPIKQTQLEITDEAQRDIERVKSTLSGSNEEEKATEVLEKAYKISKEVRMGADKYADEVLSTLEATSSRILRAVKAGRSRLGKGPTQDNKLESAESR
jgi:hypothetical protein